MSLSFLIDSAPVRAASVLGSIANKSRGQRKALPLLSTTVHYKGYTFPNRGKIYPARGQERGERKRGKPSCIQLQLCPEILGSKKRTFTDTALAASPVEAFPAAKICAGPGGRLPGHSHPLSCKCAELLKGLPSNSRIFSRVWSQHWKENKTTAWTWSSISLSQNLQLSQSRANTGPAFGEFQRLYCSLFKWGRGKKPAREPRETREVLFNYPVFHGL